MCHNAQDSPLAPPQRITSPSVPRLRSPGQNKAINQHSIPQHLICKQTGSSPLETDQIHGFRSYLHVYIRACVPVYTHKHVYTHVYTHTHMGSNPIGQQQHKFIPRVLECPPKAQRMRAQEAFILAQAGFHHCCVPWSHHFTSLEHWFPQNAMRSV